MRIATAGRSQIAHRFGAIACNDGEQSLPGGTLELEHAEGFQEAGRQSTLVSPESALGANQSYRSDCTVGWCWDYLSIVVRSLTIAAHNAVRHVQRRSSGERIAAQGLPYQIGIGQHHGVHLTQLKTDDRSPATAQCGQRLVRLSGAERQQIAQYRQTPRARRQFWAAPRWRTFGSVPIMSGDENGNDDDQNEMLELFCVFAKFDRIMRLSVGKTICSRNGVAQFFFASYKKVIYATKI